MNTLQIISIIVGLLGSGGLIGLLIWLWKNGKFFGALEERLKCLPGLQQHISQITNAIVEIQTHMTGRGYIINQRLVITSASPIRLTEYGEQLMRESKFYETAKNNRKFFIDLVNAKNPKSNYDVQEFSYRVLQELANAGNELLLPLKEHAYQKGLVLDILLQAAGIVLRDIVNEEIKFDDKTLE